MTTEYRHHIDVRFASKVERTPRTLEIAEAFGLGLDEKEFVVFDHLAFTTQQGDCVYVTGQSGSGKSVLLRELIRQYREDYKLKVGVLGEETLEDKPLIEQLGMDTDEACRLLSKAGLNDAYLFIRRPSELSDGQKYRFRIAKLIESGAEVLVADEFGAVLDRVTAKVIAYSVRKWCQQAGITLVVATTHKDLQFDLRPTLVIDKEYAEKLKVSQTDRASLEEY